MSNKILKEEELKKLVDEITQKVREYGNTVIRGRTIREIGSKPYLTSISTAKIFKGTDLYNARYVRIDYLKTSDTVIMVFKKVVLE